MATTREPDSPSRAVRRATRTTGAVLLAWGLLCATHEGEFWPFSIYPMFSQAGRPWTRVLVRDVTADAPGVDWSPRGLEDLPGTPVPLAEFGVFQNDLADYVARTPSWSESQRNALRGMFANPALRSRSLLVMKVHGSVDSRDSVRVLVEPWVLIGDSVLLAPRADVGRDR